MTTFERNHSYWTNSATFSNAIRSVFRHLKRNGLVRLMAVRVLIKKEFTYY